MKEGGAGKQVNCSPSGQSRSVSSVDTNCHGRNKTAIDFAVPGLGISERSKGAEKASFRRVVGQNGVNVVLYLLEVRSQTMRNFGKILQID